jgi:hypothetical protein
MLVAKQVADLITWARALLTAWLPWLGITQGAKSLPLVVIFMIINWTADSIDGALARRSRIQYRTWIGDHDLQVDMLVSLGVLGYLSAASLIFWQVGTIYVLLWLVVFWRFGLPHVLGVLFQAPIYGWFGVLAIREVPQAGLWVVVWILAATIVTWPKFPKVIVPEFLRDVRNFINREEQSSQ